MDEKSRRKQLAADYKRSHPETGVYRIVNTATGKALLGSTPNLAIICSNLVISQKTGTSVALGSVRRPPPEYDRER